jgi:hypothetical protein
MRSDPRLQTHLFHAADCDLVLSNDCLGFTLSSITRSSTRYPFRFNHDVQDSTSAVLRGDQHSVD